MVVKKIKGSSIAEVVIALAIISLSFAMVARIFTQASRSTILFEVVRDQSEIQGFVMNALLKDSLPSESNWTNKSSTIVQSKPNPLNIVNVQLMSSERQIFVQELLVDEK